MYPPFFVRIIQPYCIYLHNTIMNLFVFFSIRIFYKKSSCFLTKTKVRTTPSTSKTATKKLYRYLSFILVGVKRLVGRCPTKKFDYVRLRRESFEFLLTKTVTKKITSPNQKIETRYCIFTHSIIQGCKDNDCNTAFYRTVLSK